MNYERNRVNIWIVFIEETNPFLSLFPENSKYLVAFLVTSTASFSLDHPNEKQINSMIVCRGVQNWMFCK